MSGTVTKASCLSVFRTHKDEPSHLSCLIVIAYVNFTSVYQGMIVIVALWFPVLVEMNSVCCQLRSTLANISARNVSTLNCRLMYGGYTVQGWWVLRLHTRMHR